MKHFLGLIHVNNLIPSVTVEEVYTLIHALYISRCFQKEDEIQLRDYHFSIFWSNPLWFLLQTHAGY